MLATAPPPAVQLVRADAAFRAAVAGWDGAGPLPAAAVDAAVRIQVVELRLERDPRLDRVVLRSLPPRLRADVADDVVAYGELAALARSDRRKAPPLRLGPALPAARLQAFYREAQRRSGVAWSVLAAINFVESDFGRLREPSSAGAQGPMQFMPTTWAQYGQGDVHDPRAAILGAARYLRAAGAAADLRGALYRYNPSGAYVDAVLRCAARIRRDPVGLAFLYARRLLRPTAHGYRRLNGRT